MARYLERQGWLVRDAGNRYLSAASVDADPDSPLNQLLGSSITYRIAMGPQQGRTVFTLPALPDCRADHPRAHTVGKVAGVSLHAGVATRAHERAKLERLCRYVSGPPLSTQRLSLTRHGKGRKAQTSEQLPDQTPAERRASMTGVQRLKRVFNTEEKGC